MIEFIGYISLPIVIGISFFLGKYIAFVNGDRYKQEIKELERDNEYRKEILAIRLKTIEKQIEQIADLENKLEITKN